MCWCAVKKLLTHSLTGQAAVSGSTVEFDASCAAEDELKDGSGSGCSISCGPGTACAGVDSSGSWDGSDGEMAGDSDNCLLVISDGANSWSWNMSRLTGHSPVLRKPFAAVCAVAAFWKAGVSSCAIWNTETVLPGWLLSHLVTSVL